MQHSGKCVVYVGKAFKVTLWVICGSADKLLIISGFLRSFQPDKSVGPSRRHLRDEIPIVILAKFKECSLIWNKVNCRKVRYSAGIEMTGATCLTRHSHQMITSTKIQVELSYF
jgi:hypothetical protein